MITKEIDNETKQYTSKIINIENIMKEYNNFNEIFSNYNDK